MKFRRLVVSVIFISAFAMLMFVLAVGVGAQAGSGDSPIPTPAPPAPVDPGQIPALPDFLEQMAGPGGWFALGVIASMVLADWDWYNQQPNKVKRAIPVALSAVGSMVARALVTFVPADFWAAIGPYWLVIAGTVTTWLGSQAWYQVGVREG